MLHTIQEAVELTGKSRRTIYNHCDSGLISYSLGPDGRRYFDTSELIRAYGALHTPAQPKASQDAQICTPISAHPANMLTEETALRLVSAMERLIKIEEQKLLLIEHQPDTLKPAPPQEAFPPKESAPQGPARSFADLLAGLD
jgi:hypothetical protein